MRTIILFKAAALLLLVYLLTSLNMSGQPIPLVFDVENTGVDCTKPPLPGRNELPEIKPLPDPFMWSDNSGRITGFEDWTRRRNEIGEELQHYEIGPKPPRPDTISANWDGNTLTVSVTENGETLVITSEITLPEGDGPFPAIIGVGGGSGSLPSDIFTERNVALVPFNFGDVMAWQQTRGSEPINRLYPDLTYMGAYSAWSWGVSRLIDGLELVQDTLPIDLAHLGFTGCSFGGKMALFGGAFDERIALTIVQESGGGGVAAWRVSKNLGAVETLNATSQIWFLQDIELFKHDYVYRLPYDHHELTAMIAPRAVFIIGNPAQVWLAEESGYVSATAAHKVWKAFGIGDRFGYSFIPDASHCFPLNIGHYSRLGAFIDRFLLGTDTVNTEITEHPFQYVDTAIWTNWWDFDTAVLGERPGYIVYLEPECGTVGSNWKILPQWGGSIGHLQSVPGITSNDSAPVDSASNVYIPFTVDSDTTFHVFARLFAIEQNYDDYWVKMDDGDYVKYADLNTSGGWNWRWFGSYELSPGAHTLTIAIAKGGIARFDKLAVTDYPFYPYLMGDTAQNVCEPIYTQDPDAIPDMNKSEGYQLGQNHPNPFNGTTSISFTIPVDSYVSLKVYNMLGKEITELAGRDYSRGTHKVEFSTKNLASGAYYYVMKTPAYSARKTMSIQAD